MGVGVSIFILTLGAILKFAISDDVLGDDISIDTIGLIFMIVGGAGIVLSLVLAPRRGVTSEDQLMHRENHPPPHRENHPPTHRENPPPPDV